MSNDPPPSKGPNRYARIIEKIFAAHHRPDVAAFDFEREEIVRAAVELDIRLPKNLGDILYSFRYRVTLPESIRATAPEGKEWVIRPAGRGRYRFALARAGNIRPSPMLAETKIPDATPGVITRYALSDEQALLAKLRYNRLVDIFTGVTCYSLQNHLRTSVPDVGQVETDEVYIGIDRRGAHYVFPIQAKGGTDAISIVQIEQDFALSAHKFPAAICRPIAAQFMSGEVIALFEFELGDEGVSVVAERHYRLVLSEDLTPEELAAYQSRPL